MRINSETSVGLFIAAALAIFFYMTFQIGVFRLDTSNYRNHVVFFNDVSGLAKKADVKIAGVKVGWVDAIGLVQGDAAYQASAMLKINKDYIIRSDAYAVVRQDGLLGVKYLELVPGDPLSLPLKAGQPLGTPGKAPVSIDELLQQFKGIANNVEDVTAVIKNSIGTVDGKAQLQETFKNIAIAAERIASFSDAVDRIANNNEGDVSQIVADIRDFAHELRTGFPPLQEDLRRIALRIDGEVLPAVQKSIEKIAGTFDRDFDKVASKLSSTADAIEGAALQTRDGFRSIGSVADKINEGKGLLGKLVNDDETYRDLKVAVQGLKNYFSKVDTLGVVFDGHVENMYNDAESLNLRDAKGYFGVRVFPSEDSFYVMQACGSMKGTVKRRLIEYERYDQEGQQYYLANLNVEDSWKWAYPAQLFEKVVERDTLKYSVQFGKVFNEVAFRFGLFESTFGCAVDYDIPFGTEKIRWLTTLEAYDFRGRDRYIHNQVPHFKWINKVFVLGNLYFVFGADDFASRYNKSGFFGIGLRFVDDDLKYMGSYAGLTGAKN